MDSESNHQQVDVVSSPSVIYETISRTLSSPSLPTLPFDLIPEILCRLSVKLLVRFRCVCKSWNSLISDAKFAKKQLRVSTVSLIHTLPYYANTNTNKYVWIKSYSLDSIFAKVTANPIAQLEFPLNHDIFFVGSCNGILCFLAKDYKGVLSFRLWNPSIRKFKELSPLRIPLTHYVQLYGFIHDPITDNYKVVVVLHGQRYNFVDNHEVKVHTLDTNSWKNMQKFPFGFNSWQVVGKCVSGTINWLVAKDYDNKLQHCIVSLHFGDETYKVVSMPVDGYILLHISVLRDCLCMVIDHDVWVMMEHGNKDSWTKLFTISYMQDLPGSYANIKVVHVFEDGQVLLKCIEGGTRKLIFYNSRNGTYKSTKFVYTCDVCVESLISPCS